VSPPSPPTPLNSIQVAHKATNARPKVKIDEYHLSSNNQHEQNEKEHANFHGWVPMVEQVVLAFILNENENSCNWL